MTELKNTPKHQDLIFDVGLHRGEDTEFYLRKGFRVISFDANPDLIAACRAKFADYIYSGQLTLIEGAILDPVSTGKTPERVPFFVNEVGSVWGTVSRDWAVRNATEGNPSHLIEVDAVDFREVLQRYGIPRYMKVDIEGCDTICLKALAFFQQRPDFLSIESNKVSFKALRRELDLFTQLGYTHFQAVEQSAVPSQRVPATPLEGRFCQHTFPADASGLFGAELPGKWRSKAQLLSKYRWIFLGYKLLGEGGALYKLRGSYSATLRRWIARLISRQTGAAVPGWYDTHARLTPPGTDGKVFQTAIDPIDSAR